MSAQGRMAVGHPVDVATGTMFNTWVDFVVGGIVPLTFTRFYSTALASRGASGPLGLGWRHRYQHELRQTVEGFAYVDAEGAEIAVEDLAGELASHGRLLIARDQLELRGTPDEIELIPYGPGQPFSYWFSRRRGTAQYVLRALGRNQSLRLTFEHDAQGRLTRVVQNRSGRALAFEHDRADRIASVWFESQGRRDRAVHFAYDTDGRLVSAGDQSGQTWRYEYDRAGLMLSEVSNLGPLHTFRYDATSRCVYASGPDRFEERQLTYFPREHRTEVADSHGHVTTYRYNDAGQVVEVADPLGHKRSYDFDGDGRMVGVVDASGKSARMEYDRWGHLCAATYPDGRKAGTTFDDRHLPAEIRDYWGNVWRYHYDDQGQLLWSDNPLGHRWSYDYNAHGEVTAVRSPSGATARRRWDQFGNPHGYVEPDGGEWTSEFDPYGRCTLQRDPNGGVTSFAYDARGNLVRVVEPDGRSIETTRDAARGAQSSATSDASETITLFNACGRPVEQWLPDGSVVRYAWDTEPGHLLSITDGLGRSVRYEYDAVGRLVERTNWDGARTRFERDALGRMTAVIEPTGERTEFAYDDWGHLVKRTAADGAVTSYGYDANSLVVRIETADALVELERNCYGQVLVERQNGVAVAYGYDHAGRHVELRSDLGADVRYDWTPGGACAAVGYRGRTVRFEYDPLGQEVACELPGRWRLEQTYDRFGRLETQTCTHPSGPVDPPTAPRSQRAPIVARKYQYSSRGYLESISDSLRGAARFVHDALGRLHAVVTPGEGIECFGYDRGHNRTFAIRASGAAADPLLQELMEKGAVEPRELTADEELERTDRGAANDTVRLSRGAKTVRYEYDARGQLAHREVEDGGSVQRWSFEWNATGQLTALQRPDGARWRYLYDGLGRRIAKIAPDGTRRTYVWDGDSLLHDASPAGVTTYVQHPNAYSPLIREAAGAVEYSLLDHLGSVVERIDEQGAVVWRSRRGPWGEPQEVEEGAPGFPGQQLDAESGLYYNHHRYYDPELGKYISPDPVGLIGGLNEYAYVPSPVQGADVFGLWGGGPFKWKSVHQNKNNYPDLRYQGKKLSDSNRYVYSTKEKNPTTGELETVPQYRRPKVPAPQKGTDSKGYTLAVITGPTYTHGQEYDAFVSGYSHNEMGHDALGKQALQKELFGGYVNKTGEGYGKLNGNFCHAEIEAVVWLAEKDAHGRTNLDRLAGDDVVHLYIDRPPCTANKEDGPCCFDAIRHFLKTDMGSKVVVHFIQTTDGKREDVTWRQTTDESGKRDIHESVATDKCT